MKYDLVVIGGGTAGLVSAAGGASLGARVALVERDRLGGDCLFYGCVPTKTLVKSAKVAHLMDRAGEFGIQSRGYEVDFGAVMGRMRAAQEKAGEADDPERFRSLGVDVLLGDEARFESPGEISVDGRTLGAGSVVVATGSHSVTPPIHGIEQTGYLTHVGALGLERLPRSIVVVGAGPIGCEFAQIFARFGSEVTLVSSSPLPLPQEDPEAGAELHRFLVEDGVAFRGGFRATAARAEGGEKVLVARNDRGEEIEARGEEILVAAGRAPTAEDLGLENAGIELDRKGLVVDERLQTTARGVYAAGDITGKYLFTHVAEYQGRIVVRNALFPLKARPDYRVVPWTTFTDPEVARVGLTEDEARARHGGAVRAYRQPFAGVDRAIADGETGGFVKIVAGKGGRILGGHIIGPDAGNLIHEVALAMQRDIPIQALSTMIHVYPTLALAEKQAADNYYREKLFGGRTRAALSAFFAAKRNLGRLRRLRGVGRGPLRSGG